MTREFRPGSYVKIISREKERDVAEAEIMRAVPDESGYCSILELVITKNHGGFKNCSWQRFKRYPLAQENIWILLNPDPGGFEPLIKRPTYALEKI